VIGSRTGVRTLVRVGVIMVALVVARPALTQEALPLLTRPVNDFANVIDAASEARIDDLSRRLQAATGDTIIVATRDAMAPFADERELAVKWYENGGRGIGDKEKDAGVLCRRIARCGSKSAMASKGSSPTVCRAASVGS
jgi:uncharacterized protein